MSGGYVPGLHSRHFPLTNLLNIYNHPVMWLLLLSHLTDYITGPERLNNFPQITQVINGNMTAKHPGSRTSKPLTADNCYHVLNASYVPGSLLFLFFFLISANLFHTTSLQGRHYFPYFADRLSRRAQ